MATFKMNWAPVVKAEGKSPSAWVCLDKFGAVRGMSAWYGSYWHGYIMKGGNLINVNNPQPRPTHSRQQVEKYAAEPIYTLAEAADMIGVAVGTIRKQQSLGRFGGKKNSFKASSGTVYVTESVVNQYKEMSKGRPGNPAFRGD